MGRLEPASWYDAYYSSHHDPEGMTAIHQESARAIMSEPDRIPDCILDLGCGPGWFAAQLRRAGYDGLYHGHDFSETAIQQARMRCPLEEPSIFRCRDLTTYVVDDRDVDPLRVMIVALEVLEHLEDDVKTLKRFARKGGRVLVSVPTYDSDSHVRHFASIDDLGKRYGIKGNQWEKDRQLYLMGTFI